MNAQTAAITQTANKQSIAPIPSWLTMSKEDRATWLRENGKGYLSEKEQEEQLRLHHGDTEMVYYAELNAALLGVGLPKSAKPAQKFQ